MRSAVTFVQLDERCCFGDTSAATKCAWISNLVVWRVRCAFQAVDVHRGPWEIGSGYYRVTCRERSGRGER